ncbi:hypothetical protein NBH81_03750 [Aeromonas veronii]|uniref:hypothetical protein n=1 Tax=Aeromonas veronii TaxID=654 RepID=UPI0021D9567E|nr:hypothetical protein [Aeromonas veronii]UYB71626.1 hypothetical protein NBH81_03750 [Aeromonas veronii]
MHRIDTSTAQKDKFGAGKNGFTSGDAQTGVPPTEVSADILDTIQEEICSVIESEGITLDKSKRNQLLNAINKKISNLPSATTEKEGVVRLATDDEARLGQSIEAVMTSKNVSDAVKEMLKQMFVGIPIPWMLPEPPAWGISLSGQAINPVSDPLLAARYPSGRLPDARADVIRGWDNGRGVDPGRALLSHQGDAGRRITGAVTIGYNYRETYSEMTGAFTAEAESAATSRNSGPAGITAPVLLKFDSALALPNNTAGEFRGSNLAYHMITMRG